MSSPRKAWSNASALVRRQRVEPELGVEGFAAPAVLVLGAVVDQQEHPGGRQALDQQIEHGLRLGVDPVQVFEDQEQGLHLALAQEDALQRLQGAAPPLQGVQLQERTVGRQGFEQGEHGRHGVLEGLIQRQDLPGDLGPHRPEVIAVLEVTVGFEQVADRQVGGGLAVGHGATLQHQPALRAVRVEELVDQARFAHPGLAQQRDDLPLAGPGPCQGLLQGREFRLAPDKARQPPRRSRLQTPPDATGPGQLEDLHGLHQTLHGHWPQALDLDEPLRQPQGLGGEADTARGGELFHARR